MSDIISELPELEWRGLTAPYASAPLDFAFDLSPRAYYGVDGEGHDNTGRRSIPFPVRLVFMNTVQPGSFPGLYNQWIDACVHDKTVGTLKHPLLGDMRARVQSGHVELVAQTRAGVIMDIVFVETVEDLDQRVPFGGPDVSPEAAAEAADIACSAIGISFPSQSEAPPAGDAPVVPKLENATSLTDAYKAVKGQLFGASLTASIAIGSVLGFVSQMLEDVRALTSHDAWAAEANLLTLWASLQRVKRDAERFVARATSTRKVKKDTTLDEFASEVGNSLTDIMSLNIQALRAPVVLKGAELRYYTGTLRLS